MFVILDDKKRAEPVPLDQENAEQVDEMSDQEKAEHLMKLLGGGEAKEMRTMMLYGDVNEEKAGDMVAGLLMLHAAKKEDSPPIKFYISTYGGSADDMFSVYDVMNMVKQDCQIETIGMGKIMSAGTLLLAAGTKGQRKIFRNCRVMIHSVSAGNVGTLHNLEVELEEIQNLQDMYINAMVKCTDLTKRQLRKMLDQKVNVYLTAEEAVEYGLADEII